MSKSLSHYVDCVDREIHVTEWGAGRAEKIVMWHGLARTGRDFDALAWHLADRYHIIAPDTLGRGLSQWASDPKAQYSYAFYRKIAEALVERFFGAADFHWVGTSMGGLFGIILAADAFKGRIRRLVINDIGPVLPKAAVDRILTYASKPPVMDSMQQVEAAFRTIYKPFGALTDAEWRLMAETGYRRLDDGRYTLHYDPRMTEHFVYHAHEFEQWAAYDRVRCPVLLLRGVETDVLPKATADEMVRRGPKATLVEFPGIGHAPALNVPEQIGLIERFLAG